MTATKESDNGSDRTSGLNDCQDDQNPGQANEPPRILVAAGVEAFYRVNCILDRCIETVDRTGGDRIKGTN